MNRRRFINNCLVTLVAAMFLISSFLGCSSIVQTNEEQTATVNKALPPEPAAVLFKPDGSYAVNKNAIVKGARFLFFDYEWRVVVVKNNIATFWMDSPYAASKFTTSLESGVTQTANRTWSNGYFNATWKPAPAAQEQQLGNSTIRQFLLDAESTVIGAKPGADKVIAGPLEEINQSNQTAIITVYDVYYRCETLTTAKRSGDGQSVTIDYSIGLNDKLWLPSYQEIKDGGLWGLATVDRNWGNTTVSQYAWLRTPFSGNQEYPANNCDAWIVAYSTETIHGKDAESIYMGIGIKFFCKICLSA